MIHQDVKAPALGDYKAVHSSGVRPVKNIKNVCIHSTEGDSAEGAASWFANPKSEGSAHMVCDDNVAYRTLADDQISWSAPGLNNQGYHIELAGHAASTREQWLNHGDLLHRAAYKAALRCKLYGIPVRWVGPVGLRLGVKGLTTHRSVSFAWPVLARKAGFHTDPGSGFPRTYFLALVKNYRDSL